MLGETGFGMLLGLEAPTNLIPTINPLGDFDWVSGDQLLWDVSYASYYKHSGRLAFLSTRKMFTLTAIALEEIEKALVILDKDCYVVGPDTFGDLEGTLGLYRELVGGHKVVGVVQGRTLDEALRCSECYGEFVALPFDVASDVDTPYRTKMDNRYQLADKLKDKEIHLLGMTSIEELSWYRGYENVVSINTGLPVRLGLERKSIVGYGPEKERDSRQYMNMLYSPCDGDQLDFIKCNINEIREVLSGNCGS